MRIKTDENIPGIVVSMLREDGHDVTSVREQNLTGADDGRLARICLEESRVLLSHDLEFADIRRFPPRDHAGLVVLRPGRGGPRHAARLVVSIRDRLRSEDLHGLLWVVNEGSLRIRDDPAP
jgi:predicted nuclease of predicted toxin-antitoxin system